MNGGSVQSKTESAILFGTMMLLATGLLGVFILKFLAWIGFSELEHSLDHILMGLMLLAGLAGFFWEIRRYSKEHPNKDI